MANNLGYLLMVVAAGWCVTFLLRALPFLIFAGNDRQLPRWVEKLGNLVSPVIIGGLVIYSYATLKIGEGANAIAAWKTAWPYLAGALTVGLQLWKRNPLVSILAGTVVYMLVLNCGCTTVRETKLTVQDTPVTVRTGGIYFEERRVLPQELPELLEEADISRDREVHLLLSKDVTDLREARFTMACLARAGYTRSVLVTERHSDSRVIGKKNPQTYRKPQKAAPAVKRIRYKKASE